MRVTDLNKRPVMDLSSATTVGRIDDVVIDPGSGRLVGFELAKTPGKASYLTWDALRALGADAVTIENVDALTATPDETVAPPLKRGKVMGGIVLTDHGLSLGNLVDVEFDADSGSVTGLVIDDRVLPGDCLLGIGNYAMVVKSPADVPG